MQKTPINASHEFIFAKLHGMWANAAKDEKLKKLVQAESEENLVRQLAEFKLDAPNRNIYHKNLMLREIDHLSQIAVQLDASTAQYYQAYIQRSYFGNLKTLMHYRYFSDSDTNFSYLMLEVPGIQSFSLGNLMQLDSLESFLDELRPEIYPENIKEIFRQLDQDKDIMVAECEIDKLTYRNLLEKAALVPGQIRQECLTLVKTEIDIVNLCMALRNVQTYHFEAETLDKLWVENGLFLPAAQLTQLARCDSLPEIVSKLPGNLKRLLAPFTEAEIYVSENTLWKVLYKQTMKYFSDYNNSGLTIAAFPSLLHFETLNLWRVYEGVHFGLRPSEMLDMMICS